MIYDPFKMFVVHLGTMICMLTDDREEAEKFYEKKLKEYPNTHNLKMSNLEDYGLECFGEGVTDEYKISSN